MNKGISKRLSPSLVLSLLALFVALGGTTYAAVGSPLILGQANTADNATTKLSGTNAGAMLDVFNGNTTATAANGIIGRTASATAAAVVGTSAAGGAGVQGVSSSGSGLYGKSTSGPGVYGQSSSGPGARLISTGGNGVFATSQGPYAAVRAQNTSTGPAAAFVTDPSAAPFTVTSSRRVVNLDADQLDGLESTDFLRSSIPLNLSGADPVAVLSARNGGTGAGVYGQADSDSGVVGRSVSGPGAAGRTSSSFEGGVLGLNDGSGPGVRGWSAGGYGGEFSSLHSSGQVRADSTIQSPLWNVTQLDFCSPGCGNKGAGPLPLTSESFQTSGGTLLVHVTASAFADIDNTIPCVGATLDSDSSTTRSFCIFANHSFEHLPMLTFPYVLRNVGAGSHTIRLEEFSSPSVMSTNADDTFAITVEELPF
jgi:hypothetical protein